MPTAARDPVVRAVVTFVALGLLALAAVGVAGVLVLRNIAREEAIAQARQVTAEGALAVERVITDDLIPGAADAYQDVGAVVANAVLRDPVVRVKIWTEDGTIVYSDESRLIGERYRLGDDELEAIREGGVTAELSDVSRPENRFERDFGEVFEVYTAIQTPDGTPLLFETYQRSSSVADSGSELLASFAPVLVVALLAFALLLVPIAWGLARRVARAQADRERFLQRALDASDHERRRIAGDLHDGPVQELAGLAMQLSATAERVDDPLAHDALADSATAVRAGIRTLRSAVVGVYPPNLTQSGLAPALGDLIARPVRDGLDVRLEADPGVAFGTEVDELLYRACQEALRNVEAHAGATHVRVRVARTEGAAVLEVADDGRGIGGDDEARARDDGHVGIAILRELVQHAGGRLDLGPAPGGGTVMRVEVPAP
jgi:two-component system NarL family sensor kinase